MILRQTYIHLLVYLLILSQIGCAPIKPYRVTNFFISNSINDLRAKRVAVLPFENLTSNPKAAQLITDEINLQLGKLHQFELVERLRIQEVYKEQDLDPNRIDETTAVKIGKMLGAHAVVLGTVVKYKPIKNEITPASRSSEHSPVVPVVIQDNTIDKDKEWGLIETVILVGSVISIVGLVYMLSRKEPAEVGVSVRMINVETGQHLWQAKDIFNGKWRSVQSLGQTNEERKRIKIDPDYLSQILCQQLAETLNQ